MSEAADLGSALLFGAVAALFLWVAYKTRFLLLKESQWITPLKWSHILLAFGLYFAVAILISPLFASWLRPHSFSNNALDFLKVSSWLNFLNSLTIFFLLVLYLLRLPSPLSLSIVRKQPTLFSEDLRTAFFCWLLSCPLILFVNHLLDSLVSFVFHVQELPEQLAVHFLKMTFQHPLYFTLAFLTIIILAPLIEELLFRGFLQSYIRQHLGKRQAILITSICFAFFHYSPEQGIGNISIISSLFVFALFLGFVYEKQASLRASIALHAMFNTVNVFSLYFFGGTPPL